MIVLKDDSTFEFISVNNNGIKSDTANNDYGGYTIRRDNHQFCYDSTYGSYNITNDTVFFNYETDTLSGVNNCYSDRPNKMLWKGKKLYLIFPDDYVWKQKEHYFKWTKGKAYTLYENLPN